jgi:hypothetical protein
MALSNTEMQELQPLLEKAVLKYSERESVMKMAAKCLLKKYEKRKMTGKHSTSQSNNLTNFETRTLS